MSYIIHLQTLKAAFLDEGPAVTALVMVVNGLRVTTEYFYKRVCWLSNHVHLVSGNKWSSLSLWGLANTRRPTQHL